MRLKLLVQSYYDCKNQLNKLEEQSEKDKLELEILYKTGISLSLQVEQTKDGILKFQLGQVAGSVNSKAAETTLKAKESDRDVTLPANVNEIAYYAARLKVIEELIGADDCQILQAYEKENILRNV